MGNDIVKRPRIYFPGMRSKHANFFEFGFTFCQTSLIPGKYILGLLTMSLSFLISVTNLKQSGFILSAGFDTHFAGDKHVNGKSYFSTILESIMSCNSLSARAFKC